MIGNYRFNDNDIVFDINQKMYINERINTRVKLNHENKIDGLELLSSIPSQIAKVVFFDSQYRGVLDKMNYGNEMTGKTKKRANLQQMDEFTIVSFINQIDRVLKPSGYLFLWIDKFHLCEGFKHWLNDTDLSVVDLITWDKVNIGLGYRTRRRSEHCVIIQKKPIKAKETWSIHNIPDIWPEKITKSGTDHPHLKPLDMQEKLMLATTEPGDTVIDPASGGYSVFKIAKKNNRVFIGGDIEYGKDF